MEVQYFHLGIGHFKKGSTDPGFEAVQSRTKPNSRTHPKKVPAKQRVKTTNKPARTNLIHRRVTQGRKSSAATGLAQQAPASYTRGETGELSSDSGLRTGASCLLRIFLSMKADRSKCVATLTAPQQLWNNRPGCKVSKKPPRSSSPGWGWAQLAGRSPPAALLPAFPSTPSLISSSHSRRQMASAFKQR